MTSDRTFISLTILAAIGLGSPSRCSAEVPEQYRDTIARGLAWLVKQQHKQGHWSYADGKHSVAQTSLAGIALSMEGSTYEEGKYADNIKQATTWMLNQANVKPPHEGRLGDPRSPDGMLDHGYALAFLARIYGEMADKKTRDPVKLVLERAVKYSADSQSPAGGWLGSPLAEGLEKNDLAVTIVMLDGLHEARNVGISVSKDVRHKGRRFLKEALAEPKGRVYSTGRLGANHNDSLTLRAAALKVAFDEGDFKDTQFKKWLKNCRNAIPYSGRPRIRNDEFLHYYYARVVYGLGDQRWSSLFPDSAKDEQLTWSSYRQARFDSLQKEQERDGSWKDDGSGLGPVYATTVRLSVMQLDNTWLPNSR